MVDFLYKGARAGGVWYYGARPSGPNYLGATPLIEEMVPAPEPSATVMHWDLNNTTGPFPNTGDGQQTSLVIDSWTDDNPPLMAEGRLSLGQNWFLSTDANMDWAFTETGDVMTTQAPTRFKMSLRGKFPSDQLLMEYSRWDSSYYSFWRSWQGNMFRADLRRNESPEYWVQQFGPNDPMLSPGDLQTWATEWVNDPAGAGGYLNFYVDGVAMGDPIATTGKLRIEPGDPLYVNASYGNPSNGKACEIEWVEIEYEV